MLLFSGRQSAVQRCRSGEKALVLREGVRGIEEREGQNKDKEDRE